MQRVNHNLATEMLQMSLCERLRERLVAANQLQDLLEESDRFWSKQMRALEDYQARSLGLTRKDFDRLYNNVLGTVKPSPARSKVTRDIYRMS